jgi:hypothetical protein
MRQYPYTLDNGHGETLTFTGISHEADGDRVGADGTAEPGADPPMHVHYLQDEAARVVIGRMGVRSQRRHPDPVCRRHRAGKVSKVSGRAVYSLRSTISNARTCSGSNATLIAEILPAAIVKVNTARGVPPGAHTAPIRPFTTAS